MSCNSLTKAGLESGINFLLTPMLGTAGYHISHGKIEANNGA
jgi:hypothetical protein